MSAFTESAAFLSDFGQMVTAGSTQFKAILDGPGRDIGIPGVGVIGTDYQIRFATADKPDLQAGDDLTTGGVSYRVREVTPLSDGVFSIAKLKKNG